MRARRLAIIAIVLFTAVPRNAGAHPVPFSYLDVRLQPDVLDVTLTAHVFDLAHDLHVDSPEELLEPAFVARHQDDLDRLFADRLQFAENGQSLAGGSWSAAAALPERQSVQLHGRFGLSAGRAIRMRARLFPYDPAHQTFVNFYEGGALTLQAILDGSKTDIEYFPGSARGALAVLRRFGPTGMRHVLTGGDHWLFLAGLLLLGATPRRVLVMLAAFFAADVTAATLTMLNVMHPPMRLIDPAIALAIVYVGADNLMVRGGKDMRIWIALAFGLVHGFWFAGALTQMDLPRRAIGWSLVSFDLGAETAQLLVIAALGTVFAMLRAYDRRTSQRLALIGSIVVIVGGACLFVQRLFFTGGAL
jgi:hypothetical protein